ncbi:alpha/beta hydrolase [Flavobacterium sp. NKUCC04_CG]|uniref:alpha/beta hydrolase n=1 Tax=Flavobacterium sp. NKUCC04_CG TaxID=2842121 RepID=UPI001C5AE0F7|nr:alpha/beta hydrolase [Flavobacterium sp. NKUCC04_CG]MBW3518613.1 alpha/beta hydrolase [Flavobacterium sp. NKUCC04_CG]
MRIKLLLCLVLLSYVALGQAKKPEDFGLQHIEYTYNGDPVDILIKSKKGEENIKKPLFFLCQGSLPQPLIRYDERGQYPTFHFNTDSLAQKYHLVIVGKPYIPLMVEIKDLDKKSQTYIDSTGKVPVEYTDRNYLSYYTHRNIAVIKYLQNLAWVSSERLVVAGHSEGSTVAAKMALDCDKITHLIYSGGNPLGRIMSIITEYRFSETVEQPNAENALAYWQNVVDDKTNLSDEHGDTYRATYEFSEPSINHLQQLKIPVLVTYGTKDWSASANDYLRVEIIRQGKKNFSFIPVIGTEHNFFPVDQNNIPNYQVKNWGKVVRDWEIWLAAN